MKRTQTVDLLIATHSSETSGGAEVALLEMIRFLTSTGISLHIICPYEGSFTKELLKLGIAFTIIPLPWWILGRADKHDFQFSKVSPGGNVTNQIVNLITSLNPRICLTNTIATPWLAYAAAVCNKPHIWLIHEIGVEFKYALGRDETLKTIDILSDKIFCNSLYTAQYYQPSLLRHHKLDIIHPLSPKKTPYKNTRSPFRGNRNRFILTGAMIQRKGQFDAILAIKRLKDEGIYAELALVGGHIDLDYVDHLRTYCNDNELNDRVYFLGVKPNPSSYVQYADIVLMCSEAEAFGLVTIEGMSLGKPIIGAYDAATPEIIQDGYNGLLYELHNVNDLAAKMQALINTPSLIKELGNNAKKDALTRFSPTKSYSGLINYVKDPPPSKAINLSPLESVFTDYDFLGQEHVKLMNERDAILAQLSKIHQSLPWRIARLTKRVIKKIVPYRVK